MCSATGVVGVGDVMECIFETIGASLDYKGWSQAFDHNGYGLQQAALSERVLSEVAAESPANVGSDRPDVAALKLCFPKRTRLDQNMLWRALERSLELADVAHHDPEDHEPVADSADHAAPVAEMPFCIAIPSGIACRTRSRTVGCYAT